MHPASGTPVFPGPSTRDVRRCRAGLGIFVLAALLVLAVPSFCRAAAGVVDSDNPVDLYGPDGLAFTPDDVLIVKGGYTNTAIMATAYGEMENGTLRNDNDEKIFAIYLTSFSPDSMVVVSHILCRSDDPQLSGGGAGWHPMPMPMNGDHHMDLYKPEYFGFNEGPIEIPDVTSAMGASPGVPFKSTSWWNGGNDIRMSCLSLGSWEWDGTLDDDPAYKISAVHFQKLKEIVKDIRIEKAHCRACCISAMNVNTGESGVATQGHLIVEGVKVDLDGRLPDFDFAGVVTCELHIEGTVTNDTPYLNLEVDPELFGFVDLPDIHVKIVIDESDKNPMEDMAQAMADYAAHGEVYVGTVGIVDAMREMSIPPMEKLDAKDKERIHAQWAAGKGIDCLANEVNRTIMKAGRWLPWLATSDAANLVEDSDDIDLSNTKLSNDRTIKTQDVLNATGPEVVSNNGMDYLSSDMLVYGRDMTHHYCRLVEWFASNWLCLNLTDFQPYSAHGGAFQGADAEVNYYDLICDKKLTDGPGGDSQPIEYPDGWPPPGCWRGGGIVCAVQAAVSHKGDASYSGPDEPGRPSLSDVVMPGNPHRVLAAVVALSPYSVKQGGGWEAAYNVMGVTLGGGSNGYDISYQVDPVSAGWTVDWPPPNDDPSAETKFFYATVSNGHDDDVSSGAFQAMWDFDGDGSPESKYGNTSYTPGSDFGRLFVMDKVTGRTGVHLVDIFYSP